MRIRKLKLKDAPLMLEWMHDKSVVEKMRCDFASKTIDDCKRFIKGSISKENISFAIASDDDEYMGTVSLKGIDREESMAEFAIVVRKVAMGQGYSWFGMQEIIKYAFNKEKLNSVYWCVSMDNERACRFYDKHHFNKMDNVSEKILSRYKRINNLKWYIVNKKEDF